MSFFRNISESEIHRTSGFVQDQHPGLLHQGPCKGNQRTLSDRQITPFILNSGIEGEPLWGVSFLLHLFRGIFVFRIFHKVRSFEGVPELCVVELIIGIQIGPQDAREQQLRTQVD